MKKLNFAIVKWEDAAENSTNETDRIHSSIPVLLTYSSGYIVHEDEEKITLARDFFPAPTVEHENTVRRKLTIPKSNIKMIKKIKVNF